MKNIIILAVVIGLPGYEMLTKNNATKKLTTKADELSIQPGKTKIKDLVNDGFTFEWNEYSKPMGSDSSLLGRKYTGTDLEIKKDGKKYAAVGVINNTKNSLDLEECIVGDVAIFSNHDDYHKFSEITVNEENVVGLSVDDIKKKFKEKPVENDINDEKILTYGYEKYEYSFRFDKNGVLELVRFDINEEDLF